MFTTTKKILEERIPGCPGPIIGGKTIKQQIIIQRGREVPVVSGMRCLGYSDDPACEECLARESILYGKLEGQESVAIGGTEHERTIFHKER